MSMVLVEPWLDLSFICHRLNGLSISAQVPKHHVFCQQTSSSSQAGSNATCIVELPIVEHPICSIRIGYKSDLDVVPDLVVKAPIFKLRWPFEVYRAILIYLTRMKNRLHQNVLDP